MRITAILTGHKFPNRAADWVKKRFFVDQEFHKRILLRSRLGRKLKEALGEDLFQYIYWGNITDAPNKTAVDIPYTHGILKRSKPDIIISFGQKVGDYIKLALPREFIGEIIYCTHPLHPNYKEEELQKIARDLKERIMD